MRIRFIANRMNSLIFLAVENLPLVFAVSFSGLNSTPLHGCWLNLMRTYRTFRRFPCGSAPGTSSALATK